MALKTIRIAVKEFAVPAPRHGHIDQSMGYDRSAEVGTEIHQIIQAGRLREDSNYKAEVLARQTLACGKYQLQISGRIDGIVPGDPPIIEEIKTTFSPAKLLAALSEDKYHPYFLQAAMYRHMLFETEARVTIPRLCVVSQRNFEQQLVDLRLTDAEFKEWLARRLEAIEQEIDYVLSERRRRKRIGKTVQFPFALPRPQQLDLLKAIDEHLASHSLLIQAPTGLGKTAAITYPVLKDSLTKGSQTYYLTPKNSQHRVAEDFVRRLKDQGVKLRSVTLTSKGKACLKDEILCQPDYCEFARDYYSKVAKAVRRIATRGLATREVITEIAKKEGVCPYYLARDAAKFADLVIGDYHYGFAPLGRLDTQPPLVNFDNKPNLIIDEAHNLPTRLNEYYSADFNAGFLKGIYPRLEDLAPEVKSAVEEILDDLLRVFDQEVPPTGTDSRIKLTASTFSAINNRLADIVKKYLETDVFITRGDPLLELQRYLLAFCDALEFEGPQFFHIALRNGPRLRVSCCDASGAARERLKEFGAVVAFSATLKPFEYYRQMLGLSEIETYSAEFDSPFPDGNRKLLIIPQVSTAYKDRQANYKKIADAIARFISLRPGNYGAFFPSFPFLEAVARELPQDGTITFLRQGPNAQQSEVDRILAQLKTGGNYLLLAVQGGVLAEGVDYPGDALIGAFIVGPGLPQHDLERTLHKEYFDAQFGNGFDFAYTYPAMARVVQSAGRVIRSETDRGLIVLLDKRFINPTYVKAMPNFWLHSGLDSLLSSSLLKDIRSFWGNAAKHDSAPEQERSLP